MNQKKITVFLFLFFVFSSVSLLKSQTLSFKIKDLPDTTIYLVRYYGPNLFYADTAQSKNGFVRFDGSKHHSGMYAVILPDLSYFEFVYDQEPVSMIIKDPKNLLGSVVVKKSENTKVYVAYMEFRLMQNKKIQDFNDHYVGYTEGSPQWDTLVFKVDSVLALIHTYEEEVQKKYPDLFVSDLIRLAMDVPLPDFPRDENGVVIDSNYRYNYYIRHFWDGVDLKDPRLVYSPIFDAKLNNYFSKRGLIQHPDTIIKYSYDLLEKMDQTDQSNKMFQYTLHHIAYKYDTTRLMGMDKIVWFLSTNYYCPPNAKAYWVEEDLLQKLCEKAARMGKALIGDYAVPLILTDTTETNWINFYNIDANYTVLYFWSPTCGHCKTITPQLQLLYEKKFKERGIEVYAVADATGPDFEAWKNFISENKLSFTNVALTRNIYDQGIKDPRPLLQYTTMESLNYADTYDVYSTPKIFVLDKTRKIIYKDISLMQLEMVMDEITGHADDLKLIHDDHDGHNH